MFTGVLGSYNSMFTTGLLGALLVGVPQIIADAITPPAAPPARGTVVTDPADASAPAAKTATSEVGGSTPSGLTATTDETLAPATPVSYPSDAVDSTSGTATPETNAAEDVTPSLDAKPEAAETPSAGEPSADNATAGSGNDSSGTIGGAASSPGTGAEDDSMDASEHRNRSRWPVRTHPALLGDSGGRRTTHNDERRGDRVVFSKTVTRR